jgi:hypothetical protein
MKTSVSEPPPVQVLVICMNDVETEGCRILGATWRPNPTSAPYHIRRGSGMNLTSGLYVEHENPVVDVLGRSLGMRGNL